jgi:hypothetical protein
VARRHAADSARAGFLHAVGRRVGLIAFSLTVFVDVGLFGFAAAAWAVAAVVGVAFPDWMAQQLRNVEDRTE